MLARHSIALRFPRKPVLAALAALGQAVVRRRLFAPLPPLPADDAFQQHRTLLPELHQQTDQLRDLLARLARSQEEERRRIAADMHDGVTQLVVGARFEIFASRRALASGRQEVAEARLARSQALLDEAVSELHRVVFNLRPKTLDELGLLEALKRYVEQPRAEDDATTWQLHTIGLPLPLPHRIELAVFRTVQEALNNARRHAFASHVSVELRFVVDPDELIVTIKDDGVGFRRQALRSGQMSQLGLVAMRERAAAIGASLSIQSGEHGGTEITLRVPDPPADVGVSRDSAQAPFPPGQRAS